MTDEIKEEALLKKINAEESEIKLIIIIFGILILILFVGILYVFALIRHQGIMNNYRIDGAKPLQVTQSPSNPKATIAPTSGIIRPQ